MKATGEVPHILCHTESISIMLPDGTDKQFSLTPDEIGILRDKEDNVIGIQVKYTTPYHALIKF